MIIVELNGGLGNQMFQYAFARSLSLSLNEPLAFDTKKLYSRNTHNGLELNKAFNIDIREAILKDLKSILGLQANRFLKYILTNRKISNLVRSRYIKEPHFHYWNGAKNLVGSNYLVGYWQSEKYFKSHETIIRSDFNFKSSLSNEDAKIIEDISKHDSISLHVRRGDYISNPKASSTHGLCSIDYYSKALKLVTEHLTNPKVFIFSDDISWVKHNLRSEYDFRYVIHNSGDQSFNDMRLMSLCQHNIIANSTFSWWAAWLNANSNKIVVAPKNWFADLSYCPNDLYCDGWMVI